MERSRSILLLGRGILLLRDLIRSRNSLIQRGENRAICAGELHEVPVRSLFWILHPCGKGRNIIAVRDEHKPQSAVCFEAKQQSPRVLDSETIVRRLCAHSYKSQFRD